MVEITKEKFKSFQKVQFSGKINMTDIVTGSKLAHLTEAEYEEILFNYNKYQSKFKNNET